VYRLISAVLDGTPATDFADADIDESRALALNSAKARQDLDWTPRVDVREGIRRTIAWLCATLEVPALASA
jgi:nucleoside-diphosphate-sugar epimerase